MYCDKTRGLRTVHAIFMRVSVHGYTVEMTAREVGKTFSHSQLFLVTPCCLTKMLSRTCVLMNVTDFFFTVYLFGEGYFESLSLSMDFVYSW